MHLRLSLSSTLTAVLFLTLSEIFIVPKISAQDIKVFILAGQSNMEGHGDIDPITTVGTLSQFMETKPSEEFNAVLDQDENWRTRDDVWVRYLRDGGELRADKLSVGYGASDEQIGPELGLGHLLGDHFDEQVLIIKTCWGGKSLAVDFRPPSSGGDVGPYYTQMLANVRTALANIQTEFPQYSGGQIEIAGFGWFQGWNDAEEQEYLDAYEQNLINLIADVRSEFETPDLPFVIALTGTAGLEISKLGLYRHK